MMLNSPPAGKTIDDISMTKRRCAGSQRGLDCLPQDFP
jgi:hypothetical protein